MLLNFENEKFAIYTIVKFLFNKIKFLKALHLNVQLLS